MTREEAIKVLTHLREIIRTIPKALCKLPNVEERKMENIIALRMAIESLQVDRPSGEWICKGDYAMCSKCGGLSDTQFDGVERIPKTTAFCPHCGARMFR